MGAGHVGNHPNAYPNVLIENIINRGQEFSYLDYLVLDSADLAVDI